MSRFAIDGDEFVLDGHPHRILSGAIHYFRVHPDHWADRIRKARLMGLNTIETYVAWNLHAPEPDVWIDEGGLDLARFLDAVAAEGMHAIVRPGPYICAELDNGGLPTWLFADPSVGVRRREPAFLEAIGAYLDRVLAVIEPRQIDHGGPVVLVQVENEYGAYGDDTAYLQLIADRIRDAGIRVPLTTVDQPQPHMLAAGSLPGVHMTASFGSRSAERLATLRKFQPSGPLMSSEYWDGWFDSWGDFHHTTSAADSAADLDELLSLGASVNLYMFHGGTNFGLTSGANDKGVYKPIVTSYDYDAPLDEAGRPTEKYFAYRSVIARHAPVPDEVPEHPGPAPVDAVALSQRWSFADAVARVDSVTRTATLPTFAEVRHGAAMLVHTRRAPSDAGILVAAEIRDRVHVIADGVTVGILSREFGDTMVALPEITRELTLLVENQGRVNYGRRIGEDKGIIGGVTLNGAPLTGWGTTSLTAADLAVLVTQPVGAVEMAGPIAAQTFARAEFTVEGTGDRFLSTAGWGKGIAWVNGFCLGRYWSRPPQRTLYVPGPVLRPGVNDLVILELDGAPDPLARFVADADLGPIED